MKEHFTTHISRCYSLGTHTVVSLFEIFGTLTKERPDRRNTGMAESNESGILANPISEVEELLFLLYRNGIACRIPDISLVREGNLVGLFRNESIHGSSLITFDEEWPVVDYETHQTRMYSTKRASETQAKIEVAANFFSKDASGIDTPIALHISTVTDSSSHSAVEVKCQFFTKSRFVELLKQKKLDDGLICRYNAPANRRHNLVRCVFTPFAMQIEKHEAVACIDDGTKTMVERVSTSAGNGGGYIDVEPSDVIKQCARNFCNSMFAYFKAQGVVLDRGVFFFLESSPTELTFLWSSRIELKPWYLEENYVVVDENASKIVSPLSEPPTGTQVSITNVSAVNTMHVDKSTTETPRSSKTTSQRVADKKSTTADDSRQSTVVQSKSAAPPVTSTDRQRLRTNSPIPASQQTELFNQFVANEVKDFGFYSNEAERIKEGLKRQIRSITRVKNPPTMEVDDTPPYDDEFIAALCDPKKGDDYFFPKAFGAFGGQGLNGKGKRSFMRAKSKIFRFIESTDDTAVDDRAETLKKSLSSFRRLRSGSLHSVGEDSSDDGKQSSPSRVPVPRLPSSIGRFSSEDPEIVRHRSIALRDPELSKILISEPAAEVSFLSNVIPEGNKKAAQELSNTIADWKHSGHISRIRRKYGVKDFFDDEDEAECRRVVRLKVAHNQAEDKLDKKRQNQISAVASTLHATIGSSSSKGKGSSIARAASADIFSKRAACHSKREKGWIDVLRRDHDEKPHFQKLSNPPPSSTASLLNKAIPKYESALANGSLLGYLVGTEAFERVPQEFPLIVPVEDCRPNKELESIGLPAEQVPEVPVVEMTNLHLSLSEELISQQRFSNANRSRDLLEMMFGNYDAPFGSLKQLRNSMMHQQAKQANSYLAKKRLIGRRPLSSKSSETGGDDGDEFTPHVDEKAFSDQFLRAMQLDEKKQRRQNFSRHGMADFKEKVLVITGTFEDLVYQWVSDPTNDQKPSAKPSAAGQKMLLYVPPAYFHMRKELRSLFLAVGFEEDSVESMSLESYRNAATEELLDDIPQYVKIFTIDVSPVTVPRILAALRLFAADVAKLYADELWESIERIREMTESQGFTFVDAVLMVASGNLVSRSSVSEPTRGFAHIRV